LGILLVFLGTAVVAFICDFLMRKNDELRKLTVELKEELRRAHQVAPLVDETGRPAPTEQQVPAAVRKDKKRPVNSEALAVMERGAALAGSGKRLQSAARVRGTRDWGSLLSRNAQGPKAAPAQRRGRIPADLPAGARCGGPETS
jgi:hypothetical protein